MEQLKAAFQGTNIILSLADGDIYPTIVTVAK